MASASMFCLDPEVRGQLRLASHLIGMAIYWAQVRGATHYCAPVRPMIVHLLEHVGFVSVASEFFDEVHGAPVVPMVLDLDRVNDDLVDFARNMGAHDLVEDFRRVFADAGDRIVVEGDPSDDVYFLVRGAAHVRRGHERIRDLVAGDLFGELALLTDSARTADVVADTDCDLMVLDREVFERQIVNEPSKTLGLLRALGRKLVAGSSAT